jgi:transcriptional regulator with GAF, ATPase, and Fis domain
VAPELHSKDLARQLADMAHELLAQDSQQTLDQIVAHALTLVPCCDGAAISVLHERRVRSLSASDATAALCVEAQGKFGEGPCLDLGRRDGGSYIVTELTGAAACWPDYVRHVRALGISSMMGFELFARNESLGVLNLYALRPGTFDEHAQEAGRLLASHAAVAFSAARAAANLRRAISSRQDVGVAMGVLMERHRISADEAFATLVKESQNRNVKLREIARRVAETGEAPMPPPSTTRGVVTTERDTLSCTTD